MQRIVQAGLAVTLLITGAAQAAPVLVDSVWLEQHLQDSRVVIVDMTDDDLQYTRFHLPGAVRLAYHELLQPRVPGKPAARLDDAQFAALLGRLGIARNTHVVIYDDMGGLNAARLFWELERIGHRDVSVLDGGLVRWALDGRKLVNTPVKRVPATYQAAGNGRANEAALTDVRATDKHGGVHELHGELLRVAPVAHEVGGRRTIELHLEVRETLDMRTAHSQASEFEAALRNALPGLGEVITHIEPVGEGSATQVATREEEQQINEALAQVLQEQQLQCHPHQVRVYRVEGQLAVSFHCQFDPGVKITEAHALTELVERELRTRLPAIRRVIIHGEPASG